MELHPGQQVLWMYQPRGGYGYSVPVAARVQSVGQSRVCVLVAQKVASRWTRVERWVHQDSLTPRECFVPEVDVQMPSIA